MSPSCQQSHSKFSAGAGKRHSSSYSEIQTTSTDTQTKNETQTCEFVVREIKRQQPERMRWDTRPQASTASRGRTRAHERIVHSLMPSKHLYPLLSSSASWISILESLARLRSVRTIYEPTLRLPEPETSAGRNDLLFLSSNEKKRTRKLKGFEYSDVADRTKFVQNSIFF